jgi:hypothetical protein
MARSLPSLTFGPDELRPSKILGEVVAGVQLQRRRLGDGVGAGEQGVAVGRHRLDVADAQQAVGTCDESGVRY